MSAYDPSLTSGGGSAVVRPPLPVQRSTMLELGLTIAAVVIVILVGWHAWSAMRQQGVIDDFGVLFQDTKWNASSSLFPQTASDPYWLTLLIGIGNTLCLGLPAILLSTAAGVLLGLAQVSPSKAVSDVARLYVQIFRNIPVILQIVFWYAMFVNGPPVAHALTLGNLVFVTNRGVFLPRPMVGTGGLLLDAALIAGLIALAFVGRRRRAEPSTSTPPGLRWAPWLLVFALVVALIISTTLDLPVRKGLNYAGGMSLSIEFMALLVGLTLYGTAYVAEIVRGGLNSVPRGQLEAAKALGLSQAVTFLKVRAPLAFRLIIPPLSNQYLFLLKGTGLGLAVGFAELFQVTVTSINQTGKSIDFLVVMMLIYLVINSGLSRSMAALNVRLALKSYKKA